jgi:VWFA-related protein
VKLDGGAMPTADGPPRPIRTDSDEELEAARDDVRLFAIFLDDYHVRRGSSLGVRAPLSSFVETQLGPSDMIGLMYPLDPLSSLRMTRNHDAISKGVQQFLGRKFEYEPKNQFEQQYMFYPTETVERIRNQVSLSAIKGLITHMGSLKEGRKSLILVSEGYTNMVPPQMRDGVAGAPGLGNPNYGNPMAGLNDPNETRASLFASMDMQADLREVYATANRNNVSIYALDPRGLTDSEFDIADNINAQTGREYLNSTMDTLRNLAENTDGRAIVNRNDLAGGLKQVVRDTSAYYLLGYNSTQAPSDGKFHEIKVRVKRTGLQVRARKGHWALNAEELTRDGSSQARTRAGRGRALAPERALRSRAIRSWIGTARGENGKTKSRSCGSPCPERQAIGGGRPRQRAAGSRCADGGRRRRLALFSRPSARCRVGVRGTVRRPPQAAARVPGRRGPSRVSFEEAGQDAVARLGRRRRI